MNGYPCSVTGDLAEFPLASCLRDQGRESVGSCRQGRTWVCLPTRDLAGIP